MSMYKWAYRAVGVVICVLAGIGALALPWIMPGVASIQTAYTCLLYTSHTYCRDADIEVIDAR